MQDDDPDSRCCSGGDGDVCISACYTLSFVLYYEFIRQLQCKCRNPAVRDRQNPMSKLCHLFCVCRSVKSRKTPRRNNGESRRHVHKCPLCGEEKVYVRAHLKHAHRLSQADVNSAMVAVPRIARNTPKWNSLLRMTIKTYIYPSACVLLIAMSVCPFVRPVIYCAKRYSIE